MSGPAVLLSIVVPTLNRRQIVEATIAAFLAELADLRSHVELVVVDNASDDGTLEYLKSKFGNTSLRVLGHSNRVDIDGSFLRCVETARGDFINIFGDDDLPAPGYIKAVLDAITSLVAPGIIYANRLIADESLECISGLAHEDKGVAARIMSSDEFIREFTHWPGFISSITFHRKCWDDGEWAYKDEFVGYKFLARLYGGLKGKQAVYLGMPLLVQRRGVQSWKSEWPRYWLVSMPRMIECLERAGITSGALERWRESEVTLGRLVIDCLVAKAFQYQIMDVFWSEAARFQPPFRAILVRVVQLFVPSGLMRTLYFRQGKYQGGLQGTHGS